MTRGTAEDLRPIPHHSTYIDHYDCPLCNEPLTATHTVTEYQDGVPLEIQTITRTFKPCGCEAQIDPSRMAD